MSYTLNPIKVIGHDSVQLGCCILLDSEGALLYAGSIGKYAGGFPAGSVWYINPEDQKSLRAYYDKMLGDTSETRSLH